VPGHKHFYLTAPLDWYKYMKTPLALFPDWIKMQCNLDTHAKNRIVYLEMRCAVWGLPQAGNLANKSLQKCHLPHVYFKCPNTPSFWKHNTLSTAFKLVVDDFGGTYVGKEHAHHLIKCIKTKYELTKDWTGNLYCGIKLNWDYNAQILDRMYQKIIS
jgi:hypothetical protein